MDCTPKKVAAQNRERYAARRVKAIFQGGEKHEVAGYSFVASANYAGAIGRDTLRVVSCDAIRAMTRLESDGARSIAKTDAALGIRKTLLASTVGLSV
jgi:glyceraldehyde-3-phosphate dehydrogenase (NAD(P))